MNDEQTSFKVTDRRLFNADGSPRELTPEEQQQVAAAQAQAAKVTAAESQPAPAEQPTETAAPAAAAAESHEEEPDVDELDARDPASFVNFLMSIASNAASALGMMEHPVTHQREVDLELAKHWIDVLGMLQQKTRGNLSPQEQQIIESFLSDLRMQYVSLANSPQAKGARSYTGRDILGGK
jgi:hypothetical protein